MNVTDRERFALADRLDAPLFKMDIGSARGFRPASGTSSSAFLAAAASSDERREDAGVGTDTYGGMKLTSLLLFAAADVDLDAGTSLGCSAAPDGATGSSAAVDKRRAATPGWLLIAACTEV
jgi:hypothetical protein